MEENLGKKGFMESEPAIELLSHLPIMMMIVLCLCITAGVSMVDYWTNQQASINIFYTVPISLIAWSMGLRYGIFTSFFCTACWVATDYAVKHEAYQGLPYWDIFVLLVFYTVFALLIAHLRYSIHREKRLSRTDPLTGAFNARYFYEEGERELERSRRYGHSLSLAYLDLDNFKQVNDTLGHAAGDRFLKSITAAMTGVVRGSDMVARLGGDEFCVLFPETGEDEARTAVEKMWKEMESAIPGDCADICSFSLGLVTFNHLPESLDELMQAADRLMYEVKNSTKNDIAQIVF